MKAGLRQLCKGVLGEEGVGDGVPEGGSREVAVGAGPGGVDDAGVEAEPVPALTRRTRRTAGASPHSPPRSESGLENKPAFDSNPSPETFHRVH